MNEILKLQAKISELVKQNRGRLDAAKAADRGLTDEERTQNEAAKVEITQIQRRIADLEEQEQLEASLAQSSRQTPAETSGVEVRAGADGAKPAKAQRVEVRDRSDFSLESRFGNWLIDVRRAGMGQGISTRLEQSMRETRAPSGANVANPADGGFLVTTDVSREIFRRMNELGDIVSRVRQLPPLSESADSISIPAVNETSRATGSRAGGVQGYWVAEGVAPTASRPKLKEIKLQLHALGALGYATDNLLRHAAIFGSLMLESFAEELLFLTENAIYSGTGAGQPQGVINAAATISVSKESNQAAASILIENIVKMWSRMYGRSRKNAVWFINQDIEPQLYLMSLAVGTGGVPVYMPAGGFANSPLATLFGRPVVPIEYASTVGTVGDITLADLSQYFKIDGGSPESASSIHVLFSTFETAFRTLFYVDGQPAWHSALTPFKGSNTQSPFVTLATRS